MRTRTFIPTILVALLFAGCAMAPGYFGPNEVPPEMLAARLEHRGFSIARPERRSWFVRVSDQSPSHAVIRARLPKGNYSAFVSVRVGALARDAVSDADFAELARQDSFENTNRFKVISYTQHPVTMQGQWAIEFDLLAQDAGAANARGKVLTLHNTGYVVKHPTFRKEAVAILYSERGLPEEFNPSIEAEAKEIMKGVRLEAQ